MKFEDIIDRLSKFPRVQRLSFYGAFAAVLLLVYYFAFYQPKVNQQADNEKKIANLQSEIKSIKNEVRKQKKLEEDISLLDLREDQFEKALPDPKKNQGMNIPDLLKEISEKGRKSGLEIKKFEPGDEMDVSNNDYVKQLPITMSVEGGFHEIAIFFDKISAMERIVHVKNIDISIEEENQNDVSLTVEGKVVTFRFLNEAEREEVEQRKAKQKRKKNKKKKKAKK